MESDMKVLVDLAERLIWKIIVKYLFYEMGSW